MDLTTKLSHLIGVGPTLGERLSKLGLYTIQDLIYHFPFRYEDFSNTASITEIKPGEVMTLKGQIWSITNTFTKSKKVITKAILNDGSGSVEIVWFNQSYLTKSIPTGSWLQVSGKVNKFRGKVSLVAPQWERVPPPDVNSNLTSVHTGRLVPIYPETFGLTSKWIRAKLSQILPRVIDQIEDPLPEHIKQTLLPLNLSLKEIHLPENIETLQKARERLAFEELFYIHLTTLIKRHRWQSLNQTQAMKLVREEMIPLIKTLPFELTIAQQKVINEIMQDLQLEVPMNRLVQGDVGSGKTVVAAIVAYLSHLNGFKTIVMAPTEILAFQHLTTFERLLVPFGLKIGVYTGSKKLVDDQNNIIVGTHALLSDKLNLENVGLIIVDEQQRFGVKQRSLLRTKANTPHFLTMTATPIPRTVALTLYGDLDLSVINELPKGRQQIQTNFVPESKRLDCYEFIKKQVKEGRQVYIITPLIEESETLTTVKAAKQEFERLQSKVFPKLKLGLLHGRLSGKEKDQILKDFKDNKFQILVSTSVVEVGVDVPNATIMLIEGADRFGLAQLHQLRGRVGRGEYKSYCFLFSSDTNPMNINRLKNMEIIHDGLKLSELDLKIRGSGELFGVKQSGEWNLKVADLTDIEMIEKTKKAAQNILLEDPNLDKYPTIKAKLTTLDQEIFPD
jgi:ATP-dependent DNA helicase RecG